MANLLRAGLEGRTTMGIAFTTQLLPTGIGCRLKIHRKHLRGPQNIAIGRVVWGIAPKHLAANRIAPNTYEQRNQLSAYHLANEIAGIYRGMMVALPPPSWRERFAALSLADMAASLLQLAQQVRLSQFRKHPRGPKKPPPEDFNKKHRNHVSTKRVLDHS